MEERDKEDRVKESLDFRQVLFLHLNRTCANASDLEKFNINVGIFERMLSSYFDDVYRTAVNGLSEKYTAWKAEKKKYAKEVLGHREDSLQDKELIWREGESEKFQLLVELCSRKNLLPLEGATYVLGEDNAI